MMADDEENLLEGFLWCRRKWLRDWFSILGKKAICDGYSIIPMR